MFNIVQVARVCLPVAAFLCLTSNPAGAQEACAPAWKAEAEKAIAQGERLYSSAERVRLWRLLTLGEDAPAGDKDLNVAGKWRGTWEEEQASYNFMTMEAATRGVTWWLKRTDFSQPDFNVWFAAKLFEERRQLLGDKHPYLTQWLANQYAAFMNADAALIDASAEYQGQVAELAAEDVQYQRAAQRFYAGDYGEAADRFRAIAAQPASRYRSIAAYMTARSLVHAKRFDEALAEIAAIQSNPEFQDVQSIAEQLLGVVSWNYWGPNTPRAPMQESARQLLLTNAHVALLPLDAFQSDSSTRTQYWQTIYDLQFFLKSDDSRGWIRREFDDDWWIDPSRRGELGSWMAGFASASAESELLDWLQSMEQVRHLASGPWLGYWSERTGSPGFRAAALHVRQRAENTGSLAWILADAMWSTEINYPARDALSHIESKLIDCSASQPELMVLPQLRYHVARIRIMDESRNYSWWPADVSEIEGLASLDPETRSAATQFLLAIYGTPIPYPPSDSNDSAIKLLLSASLEKFLAVRGRYEFGDDFSAVINMMPVRILVQIAAGDSLPENLRAAIIRMAWTRAYVLKDEAMLRQATDLLPKLNPGLAHLVEAYRSSWTDAGRERAALILLLKAPSMQLVMPAGQDMAFGGYGDWLKRWADAPGRWSWFLTPEETAEESIGLFWADGWNRNDKNWWCRPSIGRLQARLERDFYNQPLALVPNQWDRYRTGPRATPAYSVQLMAYLGNRRSKFLSEHPVLGLVDWAELGKLSKVTAAPNHLTQAVISWVNEAGWLDRWLHEDEMAEALALAVRITRFGCTNDGSNRADSLAAFRLLHQRFPESDAAKHTPYWYE